MNGASFLLSPHLLELFGGMLLGQARLGVDTRWGLLASGALALCLITGWFVWGDPYPLPKVLMVGGASLLLVHVADQAALTGRNRVTWLSALGDASYSLYLLHYLLFDVFVDLLAPRLGDTSLRLALFWLWFLAIIGLSTLFYLAIEHPLFRWACRRGGL